MALFKLEAYVRSGDREIWVNPCHIVSVDPETRSVYLSDNTRVILTERGFASFERLCREVDF